MAANKSATSRRGSSEGAKRRSESVLSAPVTFPINGPKIPEIDAKDCVARAVESSADGVRVVVLPREAVVRHMLNSVFGNLGWGDTYYRSGNWWRCQIEVRSPDGVYVRKDAGPLELPAANQDRMQENTSFLRAAAKWGFAEDVMELGPIYLKTEMEQATSGKYYPIYKLRPDRFARAEDGHICMVQFMRSDGVKIVWDEKE